MGAGILNQLVVSLNLITKDVKLIHLSHEIMYKKENNLSKSNLLMLANLISLRKNNCLGK